MKDNPDKKKKLIKKISTKVKEKIDIKRLLFRIFDEPRPAYVANVSLIDKFIEKVFLWAVPQSVKPNYITLFRFICIPVIIFFVIKGSYKIGSTIFVIAGFSDMFDGAIARTRNKITDWGIFFDPFADKLLIGTAGGIVIYKFLSPFLAITIVFLELVLVATAYYRFKGEIVPAKTSGKLKMICESFGIGFIFLSLLTGNSIYLTVASCLLYLAIIFAILSLTIYRSI